MAVPCFGGIALVFHELRKRHKKRKKKKRKKNHQRIAVPHSSSVAFFPWLSPFLILLY
jgi:hypothetical protein